MATLCPGCGRKLSLTDWRQTCPDCNTNLMFHGFDERFFNDAKLAELGNAKVRVKWRIVVTCLLGGLLQKLRLCFVLLPVAGLLVPFGDLRIELPLFTKDISLGLIGVISSFSDKTLTSSFSLAADPVAGTVAQALMFVYIALGATLLCAALVIIFELFCFLGKRVMSVLLCVVSICGVVSGFAGVFAVNGLVNATSSFGTVFSATSGFGGYVAAAAFIAVLVPNLILAIKGIDVKHKEGDMYRLEVAKQLKRGEITLDELSQPIFETDEEKIAREKAIECTMNGKSPEDNEQAEGEDK